MFKAYFCDVGLFIFWGGGAGFLFFLKRYYIFYIAYVVSKLKNFRANRNMKVETSLQPHEIKWKNLGFGISKI